MGILINQDGLPAILDKRDTCHNAAFCGLAYLWNGHDDIAFQYTDPIKHILWKTFWPYKNPTYRYSNSEGFTKWLYDNILKKIGLDPHKGLNGDQTQPMNIYFAETKQYWQIIKFLFGMILRLGFYPNFEHIVFKMGHLSPVLRAFRLKPIYWFTDMIFYFSSLLELKKPMSESTTNKIRMYIMLVNAEHQPTVWTKLVKKRIKQTQDFKKYMSFKMYWINVFSIYWDPSTSLGQIIHKTNFNLLG